MNAVVLLRLRWVVPHHTCALVVGWLHRCALAHVVLSHACSHCLVDGAGVSVMFCDDQDKEFVLGHKTYQITYAAV